MKGLESFLLFYIIIIGLLLVVIYQFLIIRYKQKQLCNQQEDYRDKIKVFEFKNKQLTDSIKYAKIIQKAILPSHLRISKYFPKSFIYYSPKDHVSGDFVWFGKLNNTKIFGLVDCTGHGVPAAIMSVIGNYLLNTIVIQEKKITPSEILIELDNKIKKEFEREHENPGIVEGMDIALCTFFGNRFTYAGAYMPIIYAHNNECILHKGTKYPLGGYVVKRKKEFFDTVIEISKHDRLYLVSDGFYDQFGGQDNKPLRLRNLISILNSIQSYDLKEQEKYINRFINKWKDGYDQIDDITLIGIEF